MFFNLSDINILSFWKGKNNSYLFWSNLFISFYQQFSWKHYLDNLWNLLQPFFKYGSKWLLFDTCFLESFEQEIFFKRLCSPWSLTWIDLNAILICLGMVALFRSHFAHRYNSLLSEGSNQTTSFCCMWL